MAITIEEALAEALAPPEDYYGAMNDLCKQGWARVFGVHRDSDVLEQSNFDTILKLFKDAGYQEGEDYRIEGSSHWAVGWMDTLLVRALQCNCGDWEDAEIVQRAGNLWECMTCGWSGTAGITSIFIDAFDIAERLQEYAVLDEDDYSRREHEEFIEYLEQEVGEEHAEACARYLFDVHSYSHVDDIDWKVVEEWKEKNVP